MDSDWASLPGHLLDLILEELDSLTDFMQFIVVCDSWHSIGKQNQGKQMRNLSNHHVPMLLVPRRRNRCCTWSIYSILDNKFLKTKLLLPRYGKRFGGFSEGWLVSVDEKLAVTLYKPFVVHEKRSDSIIHLPPLLPPPREERLLKFYIKYLENYIFKVAIHVPDPVANPNDLIIAVIFGAFHDLAYIRPVKGNTWTRVISKTRLYVDVLYHNDRFYTITHRGKLASFSITTNPLKSKLKLVAVDQIPEDDSSEAVCCKHHLVESLSGELLAVKRYEFPNETRRETCKFEVFKLSFDGPRWIEMKDLGDVALFLGDNTSISVLASKFDGCQKNCIYFTHDKDDFPFGPGGPSDLGVYNLKNGRVTPYFTIDPASIAQLRNRGLIWVTPTPNIC